MGGSQGGEGVTPYPGAPPSDADLVGKIISGVRLWDDSVGKDFRAKCERLYKQYRGFKKFDGEWTKTGPRDRDGYVYEAKKKWGAELHVPLSFRTVETVVPRAIANAPKLLYLPRDEKWRQNVEAVQMLVDSQQERIDIDLPLQAIMRSGQIYGLGVGKTFWDYKSRTRRRMKPRLIPRPERLGGSHYLGAPEEHVLFDDPRLEDVDLFDFMWDPYGYDMRTVDWTAQSIWLTTESVMQMLPANGGTWNAPAASLLDEEAVKQLPAANGRYDERWAMRMRESGFTTQNASSPLQTQRIHEVLEYHDGESVVTILDRQVLVAVGENPCGEMPFQIYRPVPLQHQLVGIGALEPLEHLQRELDTLRSQRRDLVTLALCAGYAYDAGAVDPDDLEFGPASAIEVEGDPRAALMPLSVKDVPGAGYQEEQAILNNFDDVSGMKDALDNSAAGARGGDTTATEAQLVQAAVGRRIELGARRFELEVVRKSACQFLYLDQRKIKQTRSLTVPGSEPEALDPEAARYKWVQIGPGELEGEYEIKVQGGSLAARNVPQDRADASQIFSMLAGDWFTNPTKVREKVYELLGFQHPKAWLRDPEPSVPQMALQFLSQMGYPAEDLAEAVLRAREVSAPEEGGSGGEPAEALVPMSGAPQ